jgi:hypothetical protein
MLVHKKHVLFLFYTGGGRRGAPRDDLDPMDPAAYSDIPRSVKEKLVYHVLHKCYYRLSEFPLLFSVADELQILTLRPWHYYIINEKY